MHSKGFLIATFLCVTFCIADAKLNIKLNPQVVRELKKEAEFCEKRTGVPANTLQKAIDWTLPSDRRTKEFFYCVSHNTGYFDRYGHFNLEKMLILEVVDGKTEDYANFIKSCNKETLADNIETGFAMGSCMQRHVNFITTK